jgi:hypothetical protein
VLNIVDIDRGEEWGGACSAAGGIRRRRVFDDHFRIGWEEAKLRGLPPERGRENNGRIMAGRILASMAGGRDSGGGKAAASWLRLMFYEGFDLLPLIWRKVIL